MAFTETLHPRGKGATGGQFVAKGSSGQNDTVGYDANRGSGAGYGAAGGDARVKTLQSALNNLGFKDANGQPLKVDGKLGPKTTAAIKRLQRRLGLKADGLVTPGLLSRIKSADHRRHVAHVKHAATHKAPAKKAAPAVHKPAAKTGMGTKPKTGAGHPAPPKRASQGKSVGGHLAP